MENVFILFSCDQWHTKKSKYLIGVFSEKHRAVRAANEFDGYNLTETDLLCLEERNQTQGLEINYIIQECILDEING